MLFKRIEPSAELQHVIECFWIMEDEGPPRVQKIIPDGFSEIIFHYKDPYKINIDGNWKIQSTQLLAGQITKYFFLENTGVSGVFGIKLKPHAATLLFGIDMKAVVDRVVPLSNAIKKKLSNISTVLKAGITHDKLILASEQDLKKIVPGTDQSNQIVSDAIQFIIDKNGMITVEEVCNKCGIGERHLQRLFSKFVGLSPKFYSRVARFNYIFQIMNDKPANWSDIVYHAGFYDQSHFIKNFKAFTGEDPSTYLFDDPTFANFFLKKEKN